MKVINLSKFKKKQVVEIDDVQYSINTVTVKMFIDGDVFSFKEGASLEDQRKDIVKIIDMIVEISDIPREVVVAQPIEMLVALLQVAQGIDPTEKNEDAGESAEESAGEEGGNA